MAGEVADGSTVEVGTKGGEIALTIARSKGER
jgi:hypothetical protein